MFCSVKYSELCLAGISQKSQPPLPPPIPPKKSIGVRPYGFKNLYPSKKPATVTQQLQKSIDFRRIELYDFHLWRIFYGGSTSAANNTDKAGLIVSFNLPVNSNQYTVVTVLWINPNFKLDYFPKVLTKLFKTTSTGERVLLQVKTARSPYR